MSAVLIVGKLVEADHAPCVGSQKADTWACGVILYTMLYGCYPFSNTEPDYLVRISRADYEIPPEVPVRHRPSSNSSTA